MLNTAFWFWPFCLTSLRVWHLVFFAILFASYQEIWDAKISSVENCQLDTHVTSAVRKQLIRIRYIQKFIVLLSRSGEGFFDSIKHDKRNGYQSML